MVERLEDTPRTPTGSYAIVPAAGRSRRMGQQKLLLPWRGKTILEHVLTSWQESRVSRVVVVVRRDDERLVEVCRRAGIEPVLPESDLPQMKDSVCCALHHIQRHYTPADGDVWLLAPADLPTLSRYVIDQVLQAHPCARPEILVPVKGGRRGHPTLFPWPLAAQVRALGDAEGVDVLLTRHPVREIALDGAAVEADLDTPHDYERLLRKPTPDSAADGRGGNSPPPPVQ